MKKILSAILALVLLMPAMTAMAAYAEESTTFTLAQDNTAASSARQTVLVLKGENLKDMYAYEAEIVFDADKLEYVKSTAGMEGFSVPPKISGNRMYVAFTKIGNVKGANGSAILNTITFRGKTSGEAELKLESVKVVDSAMAARTYMIGKTVKATVKEAVFLQKPTAGGNNLTATAALSLDKFNSLLAVAETDKSGIPTIILEIERIDEAREYVQKLPAIAVTSPKLDKNIVVRTPIGSLKIQGNMLAKAELKGSSEVSVSIKEEDKAGLPADLKQKIGARPLVGLYIKAGTTPIAWENPLAPILVTLPYKPDSREIISPEQIIILNIDGKLNASTNSTGRYDAAGKGISYKTSALSRYAVAFVQKSFTDIAKYPWAKKQIEVLASKGIIGGISAKIYGPSQSITRADFVTLLVRTLGLYAAVNSNYKDVTKKDHFYYTVGTARKLGIIPGTDGNFKPREPITRQDMMVFTAAALKYAGIAGETGTAKDLEKFADRSGITPDAVEDVANVVKLGIITGNNSLLNPQGKLSRAEAAVVIYKVYNMADNE